MVFQFPLWCAGPIRANPGAYLLPGSGWSSAARSWDCCELCGPLQGGAGSQENAADATKKPAWLFPKLQAVRVRRIQEEELAFPGGARKPRLAEGNIRYFQPSRSTSPCLDGGELLSASLSEPPRS